MVALSSVMMPTMAATYISFSQVEREEDQIITPSWDAVASAIATLAGGGGGVWRRRLIMH